MVMMPQPIFDTVEAVQPPRPLLCLSPAGGRFDQARARELAGGSGFSMLCGRYEGIDERVVEYLADEELSIADVVLSGGEVAALVVLEAVGRCVPGVLGNDESAMEESFSDGLLEYPHYTRPAQFRQWRVPEVLRSGDHQRIARWRRAQSLARTLHRRPDLITARGGLNADDMALLAEHGLGDDDVALLAEHDLGDDDAALLAEHDLGDDDAALLAEHDLSDGGVEAASP